MPRAIDVVVYAPGLSAGGGAEATALKAAVACDRLGLRVLCLTDSGIDAASVESHFDLEIGGVQLAVLPMPRRGHLPHALHLLMRDRAHLRAVQTLRPRLLINMKFRNQLPGCGDTNWYYVHFPHLLVIESRSWLHRVYLRAIAGLRRLLLHPRHQTFVTTYDYFTANSAFTSKEVAARWAVGSDVLHPPCGSLASSIVPSSRREHIIISVGRFQASDGPSVPYKAQDVLLTAFDELVRADPEGGWHLHLVGATSQSVADQDFLERLRTLARDLPVTLHVGVPKDELADLYGRSLLYWHAQGVGTDATAHPQAQEHFGISTVEAMAAGAIPLVYGTAGPQEVVTPVSPELAWSTTSELVGRTISMRKSSPDELQQRCLERAGDFTDEHFYDHVQRRVSALLSGPPGGTGVA